MFTGIITDIGMLEKIEKDSSGAKLLIKTKFDLKSIALGASIACSGVCLTVVEKQDASFAVDVSSETLSCTTITDWKIGEPINLEASLKLGDELGGHLVYGHVDDVATLELAAKQGDSWKMDFAVSKELARFIAAKGSIALNGVSLTVNEIKDTIFTVMIIPHTYQHTNLSRLKMHNKVNLEIDMMARYIARQIEK